MCVKQGFHQFCFINPLNRNRAGFGIPEIKFKFGFRSCGKNAERLKRTEIAGNLPDKLFITGAARHLQSLLHLSASEVDIRKGPPILQFLIEQNKIVFIRHPEAHDSIGKLRNRFGIGKCFKNPAAFRIVPVHLELTGKKISINLIRRCVFPVTRELAEELKTFSVICRGVIQLRRPAENRKTVFADRRTGKRGTSPHVFFIIGQRAEIRLLLKFP